MSIERLSRRIAELEQRKKNRRFRVLFMYDGIEPEIPPDTDVLIFEFSDEADDEHRNT